MTKQLIGALAREYPLLYLDPARDSLEIYRRVVLFGDKPPREDAGHYIGDPFDNAEMEDTPAGAVRVVTLGNRHDFELALRNFLAASEGTDVPIPKTQGAAMLTAFNWGKINDYLSGFPLEERGAALTRFTADKANYLDYLVLLSRGPYSNVPASVMGETEEGWLALSQLIRRYHELTHVVCRRLYPGDIDKIRDELIADAVGIYAAYGAYSVDKAKAFLGIQGNRYIGGRLGDYSEDPERVIPQICAEIDKIKSIINTKQGEKPWKPFSLIEGLMGRVSAPGLPQGLY